MNYNNKIFKVSNNSKNGEVSHEMLFKYQQKENILYCNYEGDHIIKGQLIGVVNEKGCIDMRYQQINKTGEIRSGVCFSTPEITEDGKIILHEKWQWTSGDLSSGNSTLIEL